MFNSGCLNATNTIFYILYFAHCAFMSCRRFCFARQSSAWCCCSRFSRTRRASRGQSSRQRCVCGSRRCWTRPTTRLRGPRGSSTGTPTTRPLTGTSSRASRQASGASHLKTTTRCPPSARCSRRLPERESRTASSTPPRAHSSGRLMRYVGPRECCDESSWGTSTIQNAIYRHTTEILHE